MKHIRLFLLSVGIASVSAARTPDAISGYCRVLDRISSQAAQSEKNAVALDILKSVALGQTTNIRGESELQMGLESGQLRQPAFTSSGVRACAFQKIADTGVEEALNFLANLDQADIGPDTTASIWPASQIALASARLGRIADPQSKIEFLEGLLNPRVPASSWAVNQLCDRGSLMSIQVIRPYIRRVLSGQSGEEDIQFCEARMHVVSSSSDRARALGSALSVDSAPEADRLLRWAMGQLGEMDSLDAEAELVRFKKEMKNIPRGDSRQVRFSGMDRDIDYYLERNVQRKKEPIRSQPKR